MKLTIALLLMMFGGCLTGCATTFQSGPVRTSFVLGGATETPTAAADAIAVAPAPGEPIAFIELSAPAVSFRGALNASPIGDRIQEGVAWIIDSTKALIGEIMP